MSEISWYALQQLHETEFMVHARSDNRTGSCKPADFRLILQFTCGPRESLGLGGFVGWCWILDFV